MTETEAAEGVLEIVVTMRLHVVDPIEVQARFAVMDDEELTLLDTPSALRLAAGDALGESGLVDRIEACGFEVETVLVQTT
ncbi:hypothetical protein, partial [Burkholderia cenocepacia]|uniref:hypothetical protein n=1 Tax=Burkholderia cenocepacia TaxID=95486 RepID=UPI0038CBFD29